MKFFGYLVPAFAFYLKKHCLVNKLNFFDKNTYVPFEYPQGLRPNLTDPATFEMDDPKINVTRLHELIDEIILERNKNKNETTIRFHDLFYTVM